MQSITSAMSHSAAVRTAFIRFSAASDEGRSELRWLPTTTMGTGQFCTMKLRMAPVWDMVSVPWPMTMPSTPLAISSPMAMARALYCSGPMFSLKTPKSFLRGQVGDVGQLGHGAVELAGREGRDHRAGAVVEPGGDGAAGAQQRDVLLLGIEGEGLLGNLVDGLA